jgi:glucosamine--fructose-6-phosphate aminotransferase (isomerizing)
MTHTMLAEIEAQRDLGDALAAVESTLDDVAGAHDNATTVHLLGSGDSLFAAEAVEPLLRTTSTRFEVHTAYHFSRYVAPHLGAGDLAVPISVSGNSTRTVEAARRADEAGAAVVPLTNNPDGILAGEFPDSVRMGVEPEPGWVPGTLTYLGLVATLYALGIRLGADGQAREAHLGTLRRTVETVGEVVDGAAATASEVAENLVHTGASAPVYVLGGGPNRATARYAAAKFIEMGLPRTLAVGRETEEFAHGELWALDKNDPVFVLGAEGPGLAPTLDVAEGVREFGNDLVTVTDAPELAALGKYGFEVDVEDDLFSPLLYAVPLQLVVYFYTAELGLDPDDGSHVDPHRIAVADGVHSGKQY